MGLVNVRVRLWSLAPFALLLSGCVTAGSLNDEVSRAGAASGAVVLKDPCPGSTITFVELMNTQRRTPLRASALDLEAIPASDDLELGRALIAASRPDTAVRNALAKASPQAQALSAGVAEAFGFDLAQFADEAMFLDGDGAGAAERVLTSEFLSPDKARNAGQLTYGRQAWVGLTRDIASATAEHGWTAAFATELGSFHRTPDGKALLAGRSPTNPQALETVTRKYLVAAYMAAYFRNGEIFSLEVNDRTLKDRLIEKLKTTVKDEKAIEAAKAEIDALVTDLEKDLCAKSKDGKCQLFGAIGELTFVTRAGKSYGFPGITATIDLTADKKISTNKIRAEDVIPDLVRVLLEATGDSLIKVPGEKNSTLCKEKPELCGTDSQAKDLKTVNTVGDRIEGGATAAIGVAVRGGWLFSLNNEAAAASITTAGAVTARKISEAAAWSYTQTSCVKRVAGPAYTKLPVKLVR
jgi:hypothetical protein